MSTLRNKKTHLFRGGSELINIYQYDEQVEHVRATSLLTYSQIDFYMLI